MSEPFKKSYFIILLISLTITGCSKDTLRNKYNTITIKGSDTMVILGQRWAENYMKFHSDTIIQVTGGGSGTGIAALINGATDICMASRPMKEEEKNLVFKKHNKSVKEIPVALDGIAIYVNEDNPIESLTLKQIKYIYQGKIKKWSEIGWANKEIVLYGRENNSGTYMYFKEHVLEEEDFIDCVQALPGTAAVVNAISKDKYSIGYGGMAYAKGIKEIFVRENEKSKPFKPTVENIKSNKYPVSRKLFFYTIGEPLGNVLDFIKWVLSSEGQCICEEVGFIGITK